MRTEDFYEQHICFKDDDFCSCFYSIQEHEHGFHSIQGCNEHSIQGSNKHSIQGCNEHGFQEQHEHGIQGCNKHSIQGCFDGIRKQGFIR